MATSERIQAARDFLEASDREFNDGDNRQASEKLWGAATQVVMAMAEERGWDHGGHYEMKGVVSRLATEYQDELIVNWFSIAEKFHANFYHNFMRDYQLATDRPVVHQFVERLLEYHDRC